MDYYEIVDFSVGCIVGAIFVWLLYMVKDNGEK